MCCVTSYIKIIKNSGSKVTQAVLQFAADIIKKRKQKMVIMIDVILFEEFDGDIPSCLSIQYS